ncbi:MAG: YkgJ family cysteine cluster protein [Candidatus Methanomethylicaceae archaeon]
MHLIPWSYVKNWICIACGNCCKKYRVPLSSYEAIRIANIFGYEYLELSLKCYYLRKKQDGSCIFQINNICGIQDIKPLACKLWPMIIHEKPRYEYKEEAEYEYKGQKFYVYLDSYCRGITYGKPLPFFEKYIIPEFIEISLKSREKQVFSTSFFIIQKFTNKLEQLSRNIYQTPFNIIKNTGNIKL